MSKEMRRTVLVMSWITVLVAVLSVAGAKFYLIQRDNHIRVMGKACSWRIQDHYAPFTYKADQSAYGVLDFRDAYTLQLQAEAQCRLQYPLSY